VTRRRTTALLVAIVVLATALWVAGVHVWWRVDVLHRIAETLPLALVFVLAGYAVYTRRLSRALDAASKEARDAVMEAAANDALLGAVVHTATDAIITSDSTGTIRTFNSGAEAMFGYRADDIVGQRVNVLMPTGEARDHDSYMHQFHETGKANIIGIGREVVGRRHDGAEFPAHLNVNEIDLPDGKGFAGIIRDITDDVTVREALEASEEASRRMLSAVPEHVMRVRADGFILDFLPGGDADDPSDFIGKHAEEVFGAEPAAQLLRCIARCFASGAVESEEYRLEHPDGSRYYESRHVAIASDEILQISRDVTSRRQMREDLEALNADLEQHVQDRTLALEREIVERSAAEEAARASELRFRELADNIPQVYWILEPGAREFLYVSSRYQAVTGRDPSEPWEDMVHPDDRDMVAQAKRLQHTGAQEYTEYRIVRPDGDVRWLGDRVLSMRNAQGEPTRLFGVLEDITERREAELLQSVLYDIAQAAHEAPDLPAMYADIHENLRRIIDAPEFGIVLTTDDPHAFELVYDEPPDAHPFVPGVPVHLPLSRTAAVANAAQPRYYTADDARAMAEAGDLDLHGSAPEAWLGVPLVVDDRLMGVARALHPTEPDPYTPRDIEIMTYVGRQIASAIERRRAQERLAEEERLFQTLMDNAPTAIYFKDAQGHFRRVNRLCAAQRGHDDPQEMVGKTDTDYFSPDVARDFAAAEADLLRTGEPIVNQLELYDPPDAPRQWTLITKIPIFDADGKASELLGINQRVTELVEVQEALTQNEQERTLLMQRLLAAQEEERARIARELHDQVGQELTSLLLELRVLEASPTWEAAKERSSDLRALAASTLEDIRRIAFEMRPSALDDIGVVAALHRDVEHLAANADFEASFHVHDAPKLRLSGDAGVVLYRIVHAAVTNIVQHAEAKNVSVVIQARDTDVLVMVEDDGVGFDADAVMAGPVEGKFGLLAMKERVAPLGGTVGFESTPGEGSAIFIEMPYADSSDNAAD
jgi:PAS domain S-box-containing protein